MQNEKKRLKISDVIFLLAAFLLAGSPTLLSSSLPLMEQAFRSPSRQGEDSPVSSLCQDRSEEEASGGESRE